MATRRSQADIPPLTWEIPAAGATCWALLGLLLLPSAQGVAGWLAGGGFVWPHGSTALTQSIAGLLTGRPGRGLPAHDAAQLAPTLWIYTLISVGELGLLALVVWVIILWWHYLGPGVQHGMARRGEVEQVLGVSNLRRRRALIRPDLYGDPDQNVGKENR